MKKAILKLSLMLLSLCLIKGTTAQTKEFENVVEVELKNTVTIRNNNTIVGYALFYKVDKDRKSVV